MYDQFVGRGAVARRKAAGQKDPKIAAGLGFYTMTSVKDEEQNSTALNFHNAPAVWSDARRLVCRHDQGGAQCKVGFTLYSNQLFLDEIERLMDIDGVLDGPICGACGRRYFDAPEEFALIGANGKDPKTARPLGICVIHKPCRGRKGARFTVSKDHQEQRDREDNIKILKMLVNGASINSIQWVLTCPRTGERAGMSGIYDRIFCLERTFLAFERAQLGKWRKNLERRGVFRHTRVAHDDIVLGINWETSADRRITALNCTASTAIESVYVFRLDVDFDPRVEPVAAFKDAYFDANRNPKNLHGQYQNASQNFVAPLLHYQRPTGRLDEAAFFVACQSSLRLFAVQTEARWFADAAELAGEG